MLRHKIMFLVTCVLVLFTGVVYWSSSTRFSESYRNLEQRELQESLKRVQDTLADNLEMLSSQAGDWAGWDESYDFVESGNPAFVTRNLPPNSFKDQKLNLIAFIQTSGKVVYEGWYDWKTGQVTGSRVSLQNHLKPESRLLAHTFPSSSVTGVLSLSDGPLLVAARPILPTSRSGAIRGTLIMGRFLDEVEITRLSKASRVSFAVARLGDPYISQEFAAIQKVISSAGAPVVKPYGSEQLAVYSLLKDVYGKPSLLLRATITRDINRLGHDVVHSFHTLLVLFAVMALLIMLAGIVILVRESPEVSTLPDEQGPIANQSPVDAIDEDDD